MNKVGFIVDSTAIIAPDLIEKYQIEIVPLFVTVGGVTKLGTEIDDDKFEKDYSTFKKTTTSSPTPNAFLEAYQKQFERGFKDIIVLPLSEKLSGTHQTAIVARSLLSEEKQQHVHIVNTLNASIGIDAFFEGMRDALENDLDVGELISLIEKRNENALVIFEVNELKHLYNGGRLSRLKYIVGDLLKIKPLIEFKEGSLKAIGINRNRMKNIEMVVNRVVNLAQKCKNIFVNIFYRSEISKKSLEIIKEKLKEKIPNLKIATSLRLDPVFLTHVGNEGYGVAVCAYN
ncbi:MAG: DegV family protein [Erysipelotrichaceae bacterium]|jgi:DegV family protein with EDD domain|nr:DegV family protein [Erysipelotrichaceae bacterium]